MDRQRSDPLARRLAGGASRRQLLKGLGGALGVGAARVVTGRAGVQGGADVGQPCAPAGGCQGLSCDENRVCIAAAECAGLGGGCQMDEQCCQDSVCGETKTCVAAAECAGAGCQIGEQCCGDLVCRDTGVCAAAGGSAPPLSQPRASGPATSLPNTGAGEPQPGGGGRAWLAAVAGAAALLVGKRRRDRERAARV